MAGKIVVTAKQNMLALQTCQGQPLMRKSKATATTRLVAATTMVAKYLVSECRETQL